MAPAIDRQKKRNTDNERKFKKIIEIFKGWCLLALIRWKERYEDRWHLPARIKLEPTRNNKKNKKDGAC